MLAVRHYPGLVTPALRAWCQAFVKYDADGRDSRWLTTNGKGTPPLPLLLANVARAVAPDMVFGGVLLQAYRNGTAVTPCHADADAGFILSLGAPRTLRLHRTLEWAAGCGDYDLDVVTIECVEGTCLIMDEAFHTGWHHQIVPDPGIMGEKLSLVFRSKPGGA